MKEMWHGWVKPDTVNLLHANTSVIAKVEGKKKKGKNTEKERDVNKC